MTLNLLLLFEKVTFNFDCLLTNFIIIEPIKLVARSVTDILEILLYQVTIQLSMFVQKQLGITTSLRLSADANIMTDAE